jgi:hypothetical protein
MKISLLEGRIAGITAKMLRERAMAAIYDK